MVLLDTLQAATRRLDIVCEDQPGFTLFPVSAMPDICFCKFVSTIECVSAYNSKFISVTSLYPIN